MFEPRGPYGHTGLEFVGHVYVSYIGLYVCVSYVGLKIAVEMGLHAGLLRDLQISARSLCIKHCGVQTVSALCRR